MKKEKVQENLLIELQSIESRGITIWLEGYKSSSQLVAQTMLVQEESMYMRDYVFDEGRLKELHFDRVAVI